MATPEEIEARVDRLEREVARLRQRVVETGDDAGAARVLASGADRDVSEVRAELRAHTRALNALRETQVELWASQQELKESHRQLRETQLEQGMQIVSLDTRMSAGFAEMRTGMAQIVTLLGGRPPSA